MSREANRSRKHEAEPNVSLDQHLPENLGNVNSVSNLSVAMVTICSCDDEVRVTSLSPSEVKHIQRALSGGCSVFTDNFVILTVG